MNTGPHAELFKSVRLLLDDEDDVVCDLKLARLINHYIKHHTCYKVDDICITSDLDWPEPYYLHHYKEDGKTKYMVMKGKEEILEITPMLPTIK